MTTLDDTTKERKRIGERLGRLDGERVKLTEELAELEMAERVLVRLSRPRSSRSTREATVEVSVPAQLSAKRKRQTKQPAAAKAPALSLADATLRAVSALGNGVSAEEVGKYLGQEWGMNVRPNHLAMALQRHRRAGRLEQRDSRWWSLEPATTTASVTSTSEAPPTVSEG